MPTRISSSLTASTLRWPISSREGVVVSGRHRREDMRAADEGRLDVCRPAPVPHDLGEGMGHGGIGAFAGQGGRAADGWRAGDGGSVCGRTI